MLLIKRLNSYWKHTWTQYSIVVVAAVKNSRISEFWKIKKKKLQSADDDDDVDGGGNV